METELEKLKLALGQVVINDCQHGTGWYQVQDYDLLDDKDLILLRQDIIGYLEVVKNDSSNALRELLASVNHCLADRYEEIIKTC